ncbi:MAG: ribonuclease J [Pseudomonadota bacterium]|nr:ribonuclease J [Pseudomonadota bacterium]
MSTPLRITPIGGCGEFGKNLTLYLYNDKVYVVDCGIKFAETWQAGFMGIIADCQQVFAHYGKPTAYLLTHGHEDHIGALPLFYRHFPAPIYATAWTLELIKNKFAKHNLTFRAEVNTVKANDQTKIDSDCTVDWLPVNHSIPMTCSLLLAIGGHKVYHTGDFKFDPTPPYEPKIDFARLKKLQPVDLLVVDSTNSNTAGASPSEKSVRAPLRGYLRKNYRHTYITTFASNLWRVMQIIEEAQTLKRPVYIFGKAIEMSLLTASNLQLFDLQPFNLNYVSSRTKHIPNGAVIIVSGCQGERFGGMTKVAQGRFPACQAGENDLVIFSSRPIPGNELAIIKLCERIRTNGAEVITVRDNPSVHVSGHAHSADITKLVSCLKPKTILPVHGNFSHLDQVQKINKDYPAQVPANGDLFQLDDDGVRRIAEENFAELYVDAESYIPLTFRSMKDRLRLGELGFCQIVGAIDKRSRKWLKIPAIDKLIGIVEEDDIEPVRKKIAKSLASELAKKSLSTLPIDELNNEVRILFKRQVNMRVGKKVYVNSSIVEL